MDKQKRILIVDDDSDFVQSVGDVLESEGYEVLKAYNGEDGLALAKREQPDLMILDVMMAHETEGFEISRKIPETPELQAMQIIMVTGITKEMKLPFKFEPDESWLPVNAVLEKPVTPETLLKKIKDRLENVNASEEESVSEGY